MADRPALLFTCEHGGNRVPPDLRALFTGREALLKSHAGYDPGALELARELARAFDAPLLASEVSRLVVDLNRSPGHPRLFSLITRDLPRQERERLLDRHYRPHRAAVSRAVAANAAGGQATLHVAVHTFTPVLNGRERRADVGLLYDPARPGERAFCARWRKSLLERATSLTILRNSPYRGASDGLTTRLRRDSSDETYLGVELEVNQKFLADPATWKVLRELLRRSLFAVVAATGQ